MTFCIRNFYFNQTYNLLHHSQDRQRFQFLVTTRRSSHTVSVNAVNLFSATCDCMSLIAPVKFASFTVRNLQNIFHHCTFRYLFLYSFTQFILELI